LQQTGSGLWVRCSAAPISTTRPLQGHPLGQNRYNYQTISAFGDGWQGLSYGYFLFSTSKAYSAFEEQGTAPAAGNITTDDIGDLAAGSRMGRLAHIDPTSAACALVTHPADCHGSYAGETPHLVLRLRLHDHDAPAANGSFNLVNGDWDFWSDQAYHALVLERSLAGACIDSDGDGICNTDDNCVNVSNGQSARRGSRRRRRRVRQLPEHGEPRAGGQRRQRCRRCLPEHAAGLHRRGAEHHDAVAGQQDVPERRHHRRDGATSITINTVMSDEASNMDGVSFPDAVIQANGTVDLRKDRGVSATNPGNGRVYRIHFTATNAAGQSCQGDANVFVPKTWRRQSWSIRSCGTRPSSSRSSTVSVGYNRSAEGSGPLRIFFASGHPMKRNALARIVFVIAAAAALPIAGDAQQGNTADPQALQKRIAALEAGQQAILKELQEIKALLQAKPQRFPHQPRRRWCPGRRSRSPARPAAATPRRS
jgi:hypothetical protein